MKHRTFKVGFYSGKHGELDYINVLAFCDKEAKILAQAERINAGLNYDVINCILLL